MATARPVDDGAVQDTANDAVQSKASASTLGYFHDPYVQAMSKKATRRSPLINRGYYTRVAVVRDLARAFVRQARSDQAPCQVLSLGGGFDTLYFTLRDENLAPDSYIEIDYPEVMQRKHRMLQTISALSKAVNSQATKIGTSVVMAAPQYYLVSANLRDLPALDTKLDSIPIRRDYRTLFLSECALVYMSGSDADAVIAWARNRFDASSVFVLYEQILPDDPFGQTMCNNLQKRGCTLLSIRDHPSLESQQQRFLDAHWARAYALDMNTIYESILDRDDVRRIEKLELFDEFEEWHLIQAHYCVAVAFSSANDFTSGIFDAFASLAWPKKPTFHR